MYDIPFETTDWSTVPETLTSGETGVARNRTIVHGDLRIRHVEYSENYLADHWCSKGHLLFCIEGEMTTELSDGTKVLLRPGMSYHVSDSRSSHRSSTLKGAKLIIVDGGFLNPK